MTAINGGGQYLHFKRCCSLDFNENILQLFLYKGKGKGKTYPTTGHEGPDGE